MINAKEIDRQLKSLGVSFWFFGNAELKELRHILVEGEEIKYCIVGRYEGGFAVLCATNLRLLLIDKKPFYLNLEDVRYDMIVEVDFAHRLIDATLKVCTPNKTLNFTSMRKPEVRNICSFVQHMVLVHRQQHILEPQQEYSQQPMWHKFVEQQPTVRSPLSVKTIARTAFEGAFRVAEIPTVARMRRAINPYARSSFTMRQRISRL